MNIGAISQTGEKVSFSGSKGTESKIHQKEQELNQIKNKFAKTAAEKKKEKELKSDIDQLKQELTVETQKQKIEAKKSEAVTGAAKAGEKDQETMEDEMASAQNANIPPTGVGDQVDLYL